MELGRFLVDVFQWLGPATHLKPASPRIGRVEFSSVQFGSVQFSSVGAMLPDSEGYGKCAQKRAGEAARGRRRRRHKGPQDATLARC